MSHSNRLTAPPARSASTFAAAPVRQHAPSADPGLISTAQLMVFEPGLYSVTLNPAKSVKTDIGLMLPCIRLDPVQPASATDGRAFVSGCPEGGWLSRSSEQAFILAAGGIARVILSIYKVGQDMAPPEVHITRVSLDGLMTSKAPPEPEPAMKPEPEQTNSLPLGVLVHSTGAGDVRAGAGEWAGVRGSTIEGFSLASTERTGFLDLEYQAVIGKDWITPWFRAGEFCGSRGLSLSLLGYRIKLSDELARTHSVVYWGVFQGVGMVGPFADGDVCQAGENPLEAIRITLTPRPAVPARAKSVPKPRQPRRATPPALSSGAAAPQPDAPARKRAPKSTGPRRPG